MTNVRPEKTTLTKKPAVGEVVCFLYCRRDPVQDIVAEVKAGMHV